MRSAGVGGACGDVGECHSPRQLFRGRPRGLVRHSDMGATSHRLQTDTDCTRLLPRPSTSFAAPGRRRASPLARRVAAAGPRRPQVDGRTRWPLMPPALLGTLPRTKDFGGDEAGGGEGAKNHRVRQSVVRPLRTPHLCRPQPKIRHREDRLPGILKHGQSRRSCARQTRTTREQGLARAATK